MLTDLPLNLFIQSSRGTQYCLAIHLPSSYLLTVLWHQCSFSVRSFPSAHVCNVFPIFKKENFIWPLIHFQVLSHCSAPLYSKTPQKKGIYSVFISSLSTLLNPLQLSFCPHHSTLVKVPVFIRISLSIGLDLSDHSLPLETFSLPTFGSSTPPTSWVVSHLSCSFSSCLLKSLQLFSCLASPSCLIIEPWL